MNESTARRASRLHFALIRGLLDTGMIPSRSALETEIGCEPAELDAAMDALADLHGVVLHPRSRDVWVVHPFSLAPTAFAVRSDRRTWWGNCAWCSLGIAALSGQPCTITSTLGAEGEPVTLTVREGRVAPADVVVHFPIPMARAWDNVIYTCSTMLLFRREREVADWCSRHDIPMGDIQPVGKVLELATIWYGEHLRPDWTKKSVEEAQAIFSQLGLTHRIWDLPVVSERF